MPKSTSKRRQQGDQNDNVFDGINDIPAAEDMMPSPTIGQRGNIPTVKEVDKNGYGGGLNGPLGSRLGDDVVKANLRPLSSIIPDPHQPRQAIPFGVREKLSENYTIEELFSVWEALIEEEERTREEESYRKKKEGEQRLPFSITKLLEEVQTTNVVTQEGDVALQKKQNLDEKSIRGDRPTPLGASLLKIIDLAASIQRDGLANPITVTSHGERYKIETGERRWLAYNLLNIYSGESKWKSIPARTVDEPNVWRQATENNARDDLNAISKARQLAILTMALWKEASPDKAKDMFKEIDLCENEQAYYQQILDKGHPYGKGELLMSAMGMKNLSTLKRYRDLLRLPHDIWRQADDTNCPEGVLRRILKAEKPLEQHNIFQTWYIQNFATGKIPPRSEANAYYKFGEKLEELAILVRKFKDQDEVDDAIEELEAMLETLRQITFSEKGQNR